MKTKIFGYETNKAGELYITHDVYDWTVSFRKCYNNMNKLADDNFLAKLPIKDAALLRYLIKEVIAASEANEENIQTIKDNIEQRYKEIKSIDKNSKLKKKVKDKSKKKRFERIVKLKKQLVKSQNRKCVYGDKDLLIKLSKNTIITEEQRKEYLNKLPKDKVYTQEQKDEYLKKEIGNIFLSDEERLECKEEYHKSRERFVVYHGACGDYGNRDFDFSKLSEGILIYKPNRKNHFELKLSKFNNNTKKEMIKLQKLALGKEISITVKISNEEIHLTYEEAKINDNFKDLDGFNKTINKIKKEDRTPLLAAFHKKHEEMLFIKGNKLHRHIGIDGNPDGIGYAIADIDPKTNLIYFVTAGYIDYSTLAGFDANKRNNDISLGIKELFKLAEHYRCSHFNIEDLDFDNSDTDHGSKSANRKINNLWNRTLVYGTIERRCKEQGIILQKINPAYTTIIGNTIHKEYDPIAAAMMIVRRGIFLYTKFSKGNIYPDLDIKLFINDEMYDKLKLCLNWPDVSKAFDDAGYSYRRKLSESEIFQENHLRDKSSVKHISVRLKG